MRVNIKDVLPRTILKETKKLNKKDLINPISVIFAKDVKKYIIIDGHNRYFNKKRLKHRRIEIEIKGTQNKTHIR